MIIDSPAMILVPVGIINGMILSARPRFAQNILPELREQGANATRTRARPY